MKNLMLPLIFILVFNFFQLNGQDTYFESLIEIITEDIEGDPDFLTVLENLESFYENPLNINTANENDLKDLYFLNEIQINDLLEYREKYGEIFSVYELNLIESYNREILEKITPFICFENIPEAGNFQSLSLKYSKQQFIFRISQVLQKAIGYKSENEFPPKYEGNPLKIYSKYHFEVKDKITINLTSEKDPGESFFNGSNKNGFDYYSGHISFNNNSFIRNITLGDFQIKGGQGLVAWQGYSSRKSSEVLDISKNTQGINAYSSTDENQFFKGISTSFQIKNINFSLFYSRLKKDANTNLSDGTSPYFTNLQISGLHRTTTEIEDENSIIETSMGGIFSIRKNKFKAGAIIINQSFNIPYIPEQQLYNKYWFSGKNNYNIGINYRFITGKYHLFGEAALSKSKGKAFLQGMIAHLHDQLSLSLLFRHLDKNYHSFTGNAFRENSRNINETGAYFGLKYLPLKYFRVSAYIDFYRFPWLNYSTIAPSKGNDLLLQIDFQPSEKIQSYIRIKSEEKETKIIENEKYIHTSLKTKHFRYHFQYSLTEEIQFKTRCEFSYYKKYEPENGFMFYQDLIYTPKKIPLKGYFRFSWFNSDSYNTRIYTYENDLLYNYSVPAFYGKGYKIYLNLNHKVSSILSLWFKISNTTFLDRETISSGNNMINGNHKTEIKFQARFKF